MLTRRETIGDDTIALMAEIGRQARAAARPLGLATPDQKRDALLAMADIVLRDAHKILEANQIDLKNGDDSATRPPCPRWTA